MSSSPSWTVSGLVITTAVLIAPWKVSHTRAPLHRQRNIEPAKLLPAAFITRRRELRDAVIGTAPDSVAAIKAAMFRYNGSTRVLGVPDRPLVGYSELAVQINEAFVCSQTERWSRLGSLLPNLIADAWQAAHASTGELQRRAFGQLSLV